MSDKWEHMKIWKDHIDKDEESDSELNQNNLEAHEYQKECDLSAWYSLSCCYWMWLTIQLEIALLISFIYSQWQYDNL